VVKEYPLIRGENRLEERFGVGTILVKVLW